MNNTAAPASTLVNVGLRLSETARAMPDQVAVAMPGRRGRSGLRAYESLSFRELDEDSDHLAAGLLASGARPAMRLVLMVRPSIDFVSLFFAMLKAGVVTVLIDPGMGRRSLLRCLQEVEPEGFVAIPLVHAVRSLLKNRFRQSLVNVTVGRRWFWGGVTIDELRAQRHRDFQPSPTQADDPAAIIFTTGSTGPPKGVLYRHGHFARQVDELRAFYSIRPGERDLPGFPLFALFNSAMGVSTIIPDMDPTRPARAKPERIVEAVRQWEVTQAFGSPALWNVVGQFCEARQHNLPTLRRVLSAGAPVPVHVLRRMQAAIHPEGDVHTPYGATEALPVASITAREVLSETAARSQVGAGTCVGKRFPGIRWKVIRISDEPIATLDQVDELPAGETGELIVSGPVVTDQYVNNPQANALHKIHDEQDEQTIWHRMGDVGYLDEGDRFWFCGRKAHRVRTAQRVLFTIPCEAIYNQHDHIYRSALVGVGPPGQQLPVIVAEPWPRHWPRSRAERTRLRQELRSLGGSHPLTGDIRHVLLHRSLPVDIRHNAKIFREKVAVWAEKRLDEAAS